VPVEKKRVKSRGLKATLKTSGEADKQMGRRRRWLGESEEKVHLTLAAYSTCTSVGAEA
jgi:hypothetical protein